ncbi:N-alpha-acetyltransferase 35, NatC auxiliary subunit-like isoform X1 [Salvia splendens]|uniref:N-alpha-acetyltransferase 35, NatC auxiliary subunit-like isoform X1 n=1 Tax=Salvia splendens TaxID=180675 RepID=UPI001C279D06|nr:N-alpha-acetyltransferase 35, NatC auxiliary subunit-like isoform X1 [Salvia splendens]
MAEADGGEDAKAPLSPPIPSGKDTAWFDVSSLLHRASHDLRNDELITGDDFNLFAAMSALEIMDPKMDSGIVSTYYSVDEAIENGAAPIPLNFDRTSDIQCVIDIMDHFLACEATWHKGGSLAQTVYSCIYLLRPERTSSHALLHSFCRVIRATCSALVSAVSDARTNEEEDLFTMAYGLPLKANGDEKCLSMIHAVDETLCRQLKACSAPVSEKAVLEDIEPLQTHLDLEEDFCKAVLCRIRFRKHFYHVLTCLRKPQGRGLELAKKHIISCLSELDSMLNTEEFLRHNSACGTVKNEDEKTTASGCQPVGFDSTLNSRSAAPTPPRAIKLLSWKKAVNYFQKLLHDLGVICSYPLDPVFEGAMRFVVDIQKFQPDLVARAHIQLLLVQDGKLYGRESLFAVICKAALLPEGAKNHDIQKNESVQQLGQLLITLFRVLCANTAWQRRKLGKILQDWRIIYVQLELAFRKVFGEAASTPVEQDLLLRVCKHILIWVEEQTYWIALRFLMLGFELDLYSTDEYCMVYWYIYIYLIKLAEKTHLKIMLSNDSSRRKSKKKKDFVKDVGKDYQVPPVVQLIQCYIYVAQGLMMMLASLRNENKIFLCQGPFNSEHERFVQHFEVLQKACLPDHASFFSFSETVANIRFSTVSMHNCFKDAQKIAKDLRGGFANNPDRLAELRRIEQVAEHNHVALNLLCRLGSLEPSLKVSFDFIHHPHFATASVKRS